MENQIKKEDLVNIKNMLDLKKRFLGSLEGNLKALNEIIPLVSSCVKDYEVQIEQINKAIENFKEEK